MRIKTCRGGATLCKGKTSRCMGDRSILSRKKDHKTFWERASPGRAFSGQPESRGHGFWSAPQSSWRSEAHALSPLGSGHWRHRLSSLYCSFGHMSRSSQTFSKALPRCLSSIDYIIICGGKVTTRIISDTS